MRFCVITTTINVPAILATYARLASSVEIVVTGDERTPHDEVRAALAGLDAVTYLDPDDQRSLGYRCSEIIGWNTIQRRNIALLEAIRRRPDVIVTIDDDNYPADSTYFEHFRRVLDGPVDGLAGETHHGWFDVGQTFDPPFHHRGFPCDLRDQVPELRLEPVIDAEVGVAAGLWLGDPDVDAATRLVNRPMVKSISSVAESGILVRPSTWTVFNSQNTAFRTELAPLMMVWPATGRYDDIWASYAAQRVMREDDWHVHFGPPLVWQQRNPQGVVDNLAAEVLGMQRTPRLIEALDKMHLAGSSPLERLRSLFDQLAPLDLVPARAIEAGQAWCDDVAGLTAGVPVR